MRTLGWRWQRWDRRGRLALSKYRFDSYTKGSFIWAIQILVENKPFSMMAVRSHDNITGVVKSNEGVFMVGHRFSNINSSFDKPLLLGERQFTDTDWSVLSFSERFFCKNCGKEIKYSGPDCNWLHVQNMGVSNGYFCVGLEGPTATAGK